MRKKLTLVLIMSFTAIWTVLRATDIKTADEFALHFQQGKELYDNGNYSGAYQQMLSAEKLLQNDNFSANKIEFYKAMCLSYLDNDIIPLEKYLLEYPKSTYGDIVRYRLATMLFEQQHYSKAKQYYEQVHLSRIDIDMDEFYFNMGYCSFISDDYSTARAYFANVDTEGVYGSAVVYYIGYMDYLNGDYVSAKRNFSSIASVPEYKDIIPFYLLQIAFLEHDYDYVVNNYSSVMSVAVGNRLLEVVRMVSEAWFHMEAWENVCDFMNRYVDMGGEMKREENYMTGYAYYMLDEYEDAERYLVRACGPDDALSQNASYHLGDCYLKLGNLDKAMQSFSIASTSGFDEAIKEDALFNYGKMKYASGGGYFDEAINVLTRYLTLYPSSPRKAEIEEYLIAAFYNSKNYDAAYEAIKRYDDPDNNMKSALQKIAYFRGLECFNDGDYQSAQNFLEESSEYRYSAKYTALTDFWLGEVYFRQGQYQKAIVNYEKFIRNSPKTEPEHPFAYYNIAYAYMNAENLDSAQEWFVKFIEMYDSSDEFKADSYNRLGDISASNRSFWRAIEYYDGAIRTNTDYKYYATYRRAMMLGMVDRVPRKIETLKQIISLGEGEYIDDAMYELGRTYMVQEQFSQAARILEEYVVAYPSSPEYTAALSDLGLVYRNLNDNDKALKYYGMIVENSYSSAASQNALAEIRSIYVDENRVDDYFEYVQREGIETDTGVIQRDSLEFAAAQRLYINADKQRAGEAFKAYTANYPKGAYVAEAYYYGSDCAVSTGDKQGAVALLEQLAAMPKNDFSERALENLMNLAFELKLYDKAASASDKLSRLSQSVSVRNEALVKYIDAVVAKGNSSEIIKVADDVMNRSAANENTVRKARFAKAKALSASGEIVAAQELYSKLDDDVSDIEGAESAFRVIEYTYDSGNAKDAENMIYDFADKNTPHAYWLGKAFIVLGDIYYDMGDAFQARATYQSIVDGYSIPDDGIIAEAEDRIKNLK